jgi:hypothetical protein
MGVSFATRKVGFDLLATVGGYGYVMKTTGGSVDASTSTISLTQVDGSEARSLFQSVERHAPPAAAPVQPR